MRIAIALMFALAVQFEVVSVKPGDPLDPSSSSHATPGGIQFRNTTVQTLIRRAYGLNEYQLEGGPKWIDSAKFNIDAKFPEGASRDQIPLMLQAMLADRFHLEIHHITKTLPEFALVVAKGGPKVQPVAATQSNGSSQGTGILKGTALPLSSLARMLISVVGAPVIDRTGLEGVYNFDLKFAPLLATPKEGDPLPTIFAALQEQLGLKLEPIKGPVEVTVIDRLEKPSEN